jgi:hypothetical protein
MSEIALSGGWIDRLSRAGVPRFVARSLVATRPGRVEERSPSFRFGFRLLLLSQIVPSVMIASARDST